jgi:hypothetical protein
MVDWKLYIDSPQTKLLRLYNTWSHANENGRGNGCGDLFKGVSPNYLIIKETLNGRSL